MFKGCWVYTFSYNSADFMPYFVRHYGDADRIVIYDNGSTDISKEYALTHHCEIRDYACLTGNTIRDDVLTVLKNNSWKEACGKAEWVIVVDLDEFLYHPQLEEKLAEYKKEGITIPLATGYEMVSSVFPVADDHSRLTDIVKMGRRNDMYSKWVIFDPNKIEDIDYRLGSHVARPVGQIKFSGIPHFYKSPVVPYPPLIVEEFIGPRRTVPPPYDLKLLHYRFIGLERIERTWAESRKRASASNVVNGWGRHVFLPKEEQERIFTLLESQAERVVE